jgi:hypothetical protein
MKLKPYYIGFYKMKDTTVWQRSQVEPDKEKLEKRLQAIDYLDKETINVIRVMLPE